MEIVRVSHRSSKMKCFWESIAALGRSGPQAEWTETPTWPGVSLGTSLGGLPETVTARAENQ